jgi:hypothetical protein
MMAFRFEVDSPDGQPLIVFEEAHDTNGEDFGLITTFCAHTVSHDEWERRRREAFGAWIRQAVGGRLP